MKHAIRKIFLVFLVLWSANNTIMAQNGIIGKFLNMHFPEQWWVVTHPFVAKKAWKITSEVQTIAAEMKQDADLDGDDNGGQVDAFRHAMWMASLSAEIHWRKAKKLGIAHEKGNRKDYERLKEEEGMIPDLPASQMDLKNNDVGIEIGRDNKDTTQAELISVVKAAAMEGRLWVLKKDTSGNYLDWQDNVIPYEKWHGQWMNDKCLVPSDYTVE